MRVLACGGTLDERAGRAALELARGQRVDRVLAFPSGPTDALLALCRREARAAADRYLEESARWLLEGAPGDAPPRRVPAYPAAHVTIVAEGELAPADRRVVQQSSLVIELLGPFVLLAAPHARRAREALESAHVVVCGGPEIVLEAAGGRAFVCPGDVARGGALALVDGPPDPRVSLWSLDGMVKEARSLALGGAKLTVQGGGA